MKRRVELSNFCFFATVLTMGLLVGCVFIPAGKWWVIVWGCFVSILLAFSLYFAPLSIEVTKDAILINRALSQSKRLALCEVKSVSPFKPTNALRICGSGGFLGFWGWFTARGVGKYYAYHGKTDDCFMVELKDGRKYLLGCKDSKAMTEHINGLITN